MIPISPEQFYSVFACLAFLVLAIFWCCELWRQKGVMDRWSKDKPRLFLCSRCNSSFVVKTAQTSTHCPKCKEICFLPRRKRF